jgi:hypothetical protein
LDDYRGNTMITIVSDFDQNSWLSMQRCT